MAVAASLEALMGGAILQTQWAWLPGNAAPSKLLVPAAGAQVSVADQGTGGAVAVFADATLTGAPLAQPLTVDADGHFPGFVSQPRALTVSVAGPGLDPRSYAVGMAADPVTLTDVHVVASDAAMLAIAGAHQGTVAVRTDLNNAAFMHNGGSAGTDADWTEISFGVPIPFSAMGAPGGVATLDGGGKLPAGELPGSVVTDSSASPKSIDSTGVSDGEALVYNAAAGKWEPGSAIPAGAGSTDALHIVAASGAALTADYSVADVWDVTLTAACTLSLAGFTAGKPDFLTLILRQPSSGGPFGVVWPAITWIGSGTAPTLQTAASSVDSVVLFSFDGGATVYGIAQTSASGLQSGTSFPGSPSDGQLFYRTDTRIMYEYVSAVTRWLSVDRKYVSMGPGLALDGTTTSGSIMRQAAIFEDVYVESWATSTQVSTNNSTNNWTLTLYARKADSTSTAVSSFATGSDGTNYVAHTVAVGSIISASTYNQFFTYATRNGSPGTLASAVTTLVVRSAG